MSTLFILLPQPFLILQKQQAPLLLQAQHVLFLRCLQAPLLIFARCLHLFCPGARCCLAIGFCCAQAAGFRAGCCLEALLLFKTHARFPRPVSFRALLDALFVLALTLIQLDIGYAVTPTPRFC